MLEGTRLTGGAVSSANPAYTPCIYTLHICLLAAGAHTFPLSASASALRLLYENTLRIVILEALAFIGSRRTGKAKLSKRIRGLKHKASDPDKMCGTIGYTCEHKNRCSLHGNRGVILAMHADIKDGFR